MVLTTFRSDGSLQTSPVTGGVDDQGPITAAVAATAPSHVASPAVTASATARDAGVGEPT
jgi:hypothetical protein